MRKQLCAPLRCCLRKNCEDGSNCKYSHSREDEEYFKRREGKGNRHRKTSTCPQYPFIARCKFSTIRCDFAHEESDRWCLKCHTCTRAFPERLQKYKVYPPPTYYHNLNIILFLCSGVCRYLQSRDCFTFIHEHLHMFHMPQSIRV